MVSNHRSKHSNCDETKSVSKVLNHAPISTKNSFNFSILPPKSFIAMDDYKNPSEMANHLRSLEANSLVFFPSATNNNTFISELPMENILNGVKRVYGLLLLGTLLDIAMDCAVSVSFSGKRKITKQKFINRLVFQLKLFF